MKKTKNECKCYRQMYLNVFQTKCLDCGRVIGIYPKTKKAREKQLQKEIGGMVANDCD